MNNPRLIHELRRLHRADEERAFSIVHTVYLSELDYENFCMDLLVDRSYIRENAQMCFENGSLGCLLITTNNRGDGVLVLPHEGTGFVKYAAYYSAD